MFPSSLIQSKYEIAKDITVAGMDYIQEHAGPFTGWLCSTDYAAYSRALEYKVKETWISFVSDPYRYVSMLWEMVLTHFDTPIKQVFAMHVVLFILFVVLNYFFIKIQKWSHFDFGF